MEAAGRRAIAIKAAKERLIEARKTLALVNEYGKRGTVWRPRLVLKEAERSYYSGCQDITIEVAIPFGVVQQQAVYAVEAAQRELIKLGGTP